MFSQYWLKIKVEVNFTFWGYLHDVLTPVDLENELGARKLVDYFSLRKLLPELQSAYRAYHSTETAVLNAAERLIYSRRKYDRVTPLLKELHWLRIPERLKFRLAVLVFKCRNKTAPQYLADDLQWAAHDLSLIHI